MLLGSLTSSCDGASEERRIKVHIQPWVDLQDLEAKEDSSIRYQEIFGDPLLSDTKRSRKVRTKRDVENIEDLVAEEDGSTKHELVSKIESDSSRAKRNPQSWRTPRNYQFVTRTSRQDREPSGRSARLIESGGRFYDDRGYSQNGRNNYQDYNRRTNFQNRRVIYYATLPEPTRRPNYNRYLRDYDRDYRGREYERQYNYDKYYNRYNGNPAFYQDYNDRYNDYYNNRYEQNFNRQYDSDRQYNRPSYPGYPPVRDNEITRVSSSIIDVTSKDEKLQRQTNDPGLSKYVIIDREPPYLRDVYNFLSSFRPNEDQYTELINQYTKEDTTERNTKKPPRKISSVPIPPVEVTVFKGKPLDIRPLDITVETSSSSSNKERPTSTHKPTTLNPIQEFERSYKY